MPVYDFHTHTFLSDGELSPMELIRRAFVMGYRAIGITDHVGLADQERVIPILVEECARAMSQWNIIAIPGVEITHVPPALITEAAQRARALGARLVVVHGQTINEPVEEGTNKAAIDSGKVDILAHPGLVTPEESRLAAQEGVYLEVSARKGHSLTNGHVVKMAQSAGAQLIIDSDAHSPDDLLTENWVHKIARGAGLEGEDLYAVLEANPKKLLEKLGYRLT
ncbi:MAG: histidinol phosphate phosphatase domain-containing protein [Chloroflexi bacterium]|nr:histidinol phosphate phosphatase domain-containing protein [Chloroflexota bacterium]